MRCLSLICLLVISLSAHSEKLPGCSDRVAIGDRGVIVERASGSVVIVNSTSQQLLCRVDGLGDLSHASMVFSRDERYAYVFGRDGGLSKVDVLNGRLEKRIIQAGNAIGGAISQDGRIIAVSNYEPGGVRLFAADTLEALAIIEAKTDAFPEGSKVVGLTDAPENQIIFSLYDAGEIWQASLDDPKNPEIKKYLNVGALPYDALMSPDGRYYMAGLFGEDGIAKLDLWHPEKGVKKILGNYGKGDEKLPVYKMPHLEGWTFAGDLVFLPAVGRHEVLAVKTTDWELSSRIPLLGQPVFTMARPDARQVWVNFAFPDNKWLQVIDTKSATVIKKLEPGSGVMHMEFTPRGEHIWVSVRDKNQVKIYDTRTFELLKVLDVERPSGIFFTARAHKIGL